MEETLRERIRKWGSDEYAFYKVQVTELDACLAYEHRRERAIRRKEQIFAEYSEIENQTGDENQKSRQQIELQNELYCLEQEFRGPWLSLSPREKAKRGLEFQIPKTLQVKLTAALKRWQALSLSSPDSTKERLDYIVDWSLSNKELVKQFADRIKHLRQKRGTKANRFFPKEVRGRKTSVKESLVRLAVWRCREAGLTTEEIVSLLKPFRGGFGLPAEGTLRKKLASIARDAEAFLFGN